MNLAKTLEYGFLSLAVASSAGCRRDDTTAPGPVGAPLQPLGSASTSASAYPVPAPSAPSAPAVPVLATAFDVKEPTAFHSPSKSDGCALDQVGGASAAEATEVLRKGEVPLIGWAADTDSKTVPPVVVIKLDGAKKYYAAAVHATPRPDVAQSFGAPGLAGAGWDLLATFSNVAPGTYGLHVLAVQPTGDTVLCDSKKKLTVK